MRKLGRWIGPIGALALVACERSVGMKPEARVVASSQSLGSGSEPSSREVKTSSVGTDPGRAGEGTPLVAAPGHELAAFAEGCFWGSENTFRHVPGVLATAVGYSGGKSDQPTYRTVSAHGTGHAETVLVEYDPKVVTYEALLGIFFRSHDPTTKNRQGPDVGDQYRSAIFTFSDAQGTAAKLAADAAERKIGKPVTTEIAPMRKFWKAEEYHQQYDEKTGRESCPLPNVLGE